MPPTRQPAPDAGDVTKLLQQMAQGDHSVLDEVFPMVYEDLRRVARGQRRGRRSHTLGTTALLHEAYLKFSRSGRAPAIADREHFFALAATAMRQILLDEAKRRLRAKRGAGSRPTQFDEARHDPHRLDDSDARQAEFMVALDQALGTLGQLHDRVRKVVEYRFFGGLSESEIAGVLGVDRRTVRRDWAKARAWLALELTPSS